MIIKRKKLIAYYFIIYFYIVSIGLALNAPNNLRILKSTYSLNKNFFSLGDPIYNEPIWDNLSLPTSRLQNYNIDKVQIVSGERNKKVFKNQSSVILKNILLKVKWERSYSKYGNTLFYIKNCKNVYIENVVIVQADHDYRASHSILIEDSENVIVKNCLFLGTTNSYHLRIEGCENVVLDGIEISGYDYGSLGKRCGGGIFVNNGNQPEKFPNTRGMYSSNPKDLSRLIIVNCYIHDNLADDGNFRNQDGIALASPGNGLFFNNIVENWLKGDAGLDVSHRRWDAAYTHRVFRIERNVFKNCSYQKFSGGSKKNVNNIIISANNIILNSSIGYYPKNYNIIHIYDSFINDAPKTVFKPFIRLWGVELSKIQFFRCLFYSKYSHSLFWDSKPENSKEDQLRQLNFVECSFIFNNIKYWYINKNKETITTYDKLRSLYPNVFAASNILEDSVKQISLQKYSYELPHLVYIKTNSEKAEIRRAIYDFDVKRSFDGRIRDVFTYPGAINPKLSSTRD